MRIQNEQHHKLDIPSRFVTNRTLRAILSLLLLLIVASACSSPAKSRAAACQAAVASLAPAPLKALFITGGVFHDYRKLPPFLTSKISRLINAKFDVVTGLDVLKNPQFADGYDVVVYDLCYDDAGPGELGNAIDAGHQGKPTVFIHCAVHSFRNSPEVHEWENYVGLRSKFHDKFGPFSTEKVGPVNPITASFPEDWKTPGDELYQTIELIPGTLPLLTARSPRDGRIHNVCWTHTYGLARVFATTLGHDKKTAQSPAYLRLLANGLLWTCDKLGSDGQPTPGYAAHK